MEFRCSIPHHIGARWKTHDHLFLLVYAFVHVVNLHHGFAPLRIVFADRSRRRLFRSNDAGSFHGLSRFIRQPHRHYFS